MASDELQDDKGDNSFVNKLDNFKFEEFVFAWRKPLSLLLLGIILIGVGVIYYRVSQNYSNSDVEILESNQAERRDGRYNVVEISGEVVKPGVYRLPSDSRVEDLLIASGGISANADRKWIEKYINRAAKLADGQKIFIPSQSEKVETQEGGSNQLDSMSANNDGGSSSDYRVLGSGSEGSVNINTASLQELDTLPGIGQVYGQNIIEHRPYSDIGELVSKGVLGKSVYEKIKNRIIVY